VLGVLVAVAEVLLDNTVHSQADIEQGMGLPFLGVVPKILEEAGKVKVEDRRLPNERDLYIIRNPKSAVAECARSIRTNLLFMGADRSLKRLLFTSARLGEGKTTTTVQVGVTMAQAGARVLIIDTDLRKPRLHRAFRISGEVGLTSLLVDAVKPEGAIKSTEVVGLDILPCGPIPPNPSELLHSDKFEQVLAALCDRYDRVLLDSPPIGAVTDAAILSKIVDGTLLVVQANGSPKEAVRRAARLLRDVDANIVGVVLNNVDVNAGTYGYQHYYYERYGYGSEAEEQANA
jgi:capsular exopolysaccharide synthesis family protein